MRKDRRCQDCSEPTSRRVRVEESGQLHRDLRLLRLRHILVK